MLHVVTCCDKMLHMKEFFLPTQFTPWQLRKLQELVLREESREPTQEMRNLAGRLSVYVHQAEKACAPRLRLIG